MTTSVNPAAIPGGSLGSPGAIARDDENPAGSPEAAETIAREDENRRDTLAERMFESLLGGMELLSVDLGRRLRLYETIWDAGSVTSHDLAGRSGIAERYAREWLEQQAVAGILDATDAGAATDERRYTLPRAHAAVLVDEDDPACMIGAAPSLTGLALSLSSVVEAYRTGTGVPYAHFGTEIRHGIGAFNRPMFVNEFAGAWLQAAPDLRARLDGGGRVLDVGCGMGWSSVALAQAFPQVTVHGVDLDEASIADARRNAEDAGVAERVTFSVANAAAFESGDQYDMACMFEALHDMGDPVGALQRIRAALVPGGALLVADERVADSFTAPGDPIERFMYGWSALHCLPATMAESTAVANGTVLRERTVREWGRQAGYATVDVMAVNNDFWRFYRLDV